VEVLIGGEKKEKERQGTRRQPNKVVRKGTFVRRGKRIGSHSNQKKTTKNKRITLLDYRRVFRSAGVRKKSPVRARSGMRERKRS